MLAASMTWWGSLHCTARHAALEQCTADDSTLQVLGQLETNAPRGAFLNLILLR
jgi:hypothetical protein